MTMLDPAAMMGRQIAAEYERNVARQSELSRLAIDMGFGNQRPSEVQANPDCWPHGREEVALWNRQYDLNAEAERRYGPGYSSPRDLLAVRSQGSYRRNRNPN